MSNATHPTPVAVPPGWTITPNPDGTITVQSAIGGVVCSESPTSPREIPEAILWALANDLIRTPSLQHQEPPETCTWRVGDDELMIWESACGETWSFSEGGPAENNVRYCVRCGKPIRVEGEES